MMCLLTSNGVSVGIEEGTVDFLQVCRGLMQPRPDMAQQPPPAREEWIEVVRVTCPCLQILICSVREVGG